MRDAVHRVHDAGAQQALAGGEEEDGGDGDVGRRARAEVDVLRVEVEGQAEHDHEAEEMGPDVGGLVVETANGADAGPVAVVEAVAGEDVLVGLPGRGQVLVAEQAVLVCAGEGAVYGQVDPELERLAGAVGLVEAGVDGVLEELAGREVAGADELLVDGLEAGVAEGVGAGLEVGDPVLDQQDALDDLVGEGLVGLEGIVVAALERLDEDGGLAAADLEGAVGDLGAGVAHGEEGRVGVVDARVEAEVAI